MAALRVLRFKPHGAGFDARLRDVLVPDLLCLPGIRGVFAGRIGPDDDGPRLLASLWSSVDAIARPAFGGSPLAGSDWLGGGDDVDAETYALAVAVAPARPADIGILRLVRGRVQPGALGAYVAQARAGTMSDRAQGVGPQALYLATDGSERFATLSLWDAWAHIEAATGSHALSADRTRHAELLVEWTAEHYEVVPGTTFLAPGEFDATDAE